MRTSTRRPDRAADGRGSHGVVAPSVYAVDGTELGVADVRDTGTLTDAVASPRAGGVDLPAGWSPDGRLYYVSDRSGWWQIYELNDPNPNDGSSPNVPSDLSVTDFPESEFGRPQWLLGTATWAFAGAVTDGVSYTRRGRWHLATVDVPTRTLTVSHRP